MLILSVLVGALSHFLWDSFTHAGGEIARMVPFLTGFTTIMGVPVMNAAIAQQISTAVGMAALILGVWKAGLLPQAGPPLAPRPAKDKLAFWVVFGASATFFAALVVAAVEFFYPEHRVNRLAIFGISGWSGFFYSLAVYTVSQRVRRFVVIFIDSR